MCNYMCCKREIEVWSQRRQGPVLLGELAGFQTHRGRLRGAVDTPKKESPRLYLCQFDLKEKRSFFGQRKDYWDFLCQGLARCRQEHEGIHFVTSLDKVGMGWWDTQGLVHTNRLLLLVGAHAPSWACTLSDTKHSPTGAINSFVPSRIPTAPQSLGTLFPLHGLGGRCGGRCRLEGQGLITHSPLQLKTPVGRGRAFLRYCLVHRQLAESLQLCLLDPESLW